ncbi:MAG: hypothetical protein J6V44_08655 [Methanobrevibacter sp.]|nr:hypothetical protein [Methanobrevibacter sp.]
MTEAQQIAKIKSALGIGAGIPDDTISVWLTDAKDFMLKAGVPTSVINADTTIGTLTRGVSDLWNYGSGDTGFSTVFEKRVAQLALGNKK